MQIELEAGVPGVAKKTIVADASEHVRRWALIVCGVILFAVVLNLIVTGYEYYKLPVTERYRSPLHAELKPGGHTGRILGLSGSAMMITLLAYSLRKRLKLMRNWGKLSTWLQVHIFLGVAGPILITFHTAFKLRGIVAISYWSMVIVAVSGAVGRYLYAQIPRAISGAELEVKDMTSQIDSINAQLLQWLTPQEWQQLQRITAFKAAAAANSFHAVGLMMLDDLRWLFTRRRLRRFAESAPGLTRMQQAALPALARERALQMRRITFLKASHDLFKYWHILHLPLAQTMYLTMIIHVAVAVMTGYFWRT